MIVSAYSIIALYVKVLSVKVNIKIFDETFPEAVYILTQN